MGLINFSCIYWIVALLANYAQTVIRLVVQVLWPGAFSRDFTSQVTWPCWLKTRKSWVVWSDAPKQNCFSAMSLHRYNLGLLLIILNIYSLGLIDALNVTASDSAANPLQAPSDHSHGSSAVVSAPVYKPAVDSSYWINLLSSFPDDLEFSEYCTELLRLFGQRYVAFVNCLVPAARPVRVCQNCSPGYSSLSEVFLNISSDKV